jgi:hypothetical protein
MIAWMRAWSTCTPDAAAAIASPPIITPPSYPQDIRMQLAVLLAGLILDRQLEATR